MARNLPEPSILPRHWAVIFIAVAVFAAVCSAVVWFAPELGFNAAVAAIAAGAIGLGAGFLISWTLRSRSVVLHASETPTVEIRLVPDEDRQLISYIIDSMEGGVMTVTSGGTVTSFNAVAQKTLGYDARDVVGQHFSAVFADIPRNRAIRNMIHVALSDHQTFSSEEVTTAKSDGGPVALGVTISLLRGEENLPRGIVLTFKNLAELKRIREHVQRAEQLASLGRLAAGMAHEIRNPLGSLHGLVELMQEDFSQDDPKRQYTGTILRTIDQLNTLVENLLEFSQPPVAHLEIHDLRDLVREGVHLCAFEQRARGVSLREDYGAEPLPVRADQETLTRAIVNVVRNAFQATPEGGTVSVSLRRSTASQPGEADQVLVAVANTGSYIPPEDHSKLFTPFFTTKPAGTGLGLPIAHQIVSAHSGQIEVTSEAGSGTLFHVTLPAQPVGVRAGAAEEVGDAPYD